jgi:hypothetical protein
MREVKSLQGIYEGFAKTELPHIFIGDFNVQLGKGGEEELEDTDDEDGDERKKKKKKKEKQLPTDSDIYEALESIGGEGSYRTMIPSKKDSQERTMVSLKKEYCNDTVVVPSSLVGASATIVGPKEMFLSKSAGNYVALRSKDLDRLKISGFTDHFPVKLFLPQVESDSVKLFHWKDLDGQRIPLEEEQVKAFITKCCDSKGKQTLKKLHEGYEIWMDKKALRPLNQDTFKAILKSLGHTVNKKGNAWEVKGIQLNSAYNKKVKESRE